MQSPLEDMIQLIGRLIARRHIRALRSRTGGVTGAKHCAAKVQPGEDGAVPDRQVAPTTDVRQPRSLPAGRW